VPRYAARPAPGQRRGRRPPSQSSSASSPVWTSSAAWTESSQPPPGRSADPQPCASRTAGSAPAAPEPRSAQNKRLRSSTQQATQRSWRRHAKPQGPGGCRPKPPISHKGGRDLTCAPSRRPRCPGWSPVAAPLAWRSAITARMAERSRQGHCRLYLPLWAPPSAPPSARMRGAAACGLRDCCPVGAAPVLRSIPACFLRA